MRWRIAAAFLLLIPSVLLKAQVGGNGIYKFLHLPPSSRTSALGGNLISVKDDDVTLAVQNPSLLNASMHKHLALSYMDHVSDINFGSVAYAHSLDSQQTVLGGIQYLNYGDFIEADETGLITGNFTANDYSIFFGYGKTLDKLSYGGMAKVIYSTYERYRSLGLAVDISGTYKPNDFFTAALVFKNVGAQIKAYHNDREPLPFDIQLGVSMKPQHMPLRLSIIAHDLHRWNLAYENPSLNEEIDLSTGEVIQKKVPFSEQIFRHFIVGGEILISKNFNLRVGYNHQLRKEMTIEGYRGMVGYSFGLGFRINKFLLSYGRTAYHVAGGSNTFTVSTDFSKFIKKSKQPEPAN